MIRAMPLAVLVLSSIGSGHTWAEEPPEVSVRDLSPLLDRAHKKHGLPAVAAVVIEHDHIVARGVAGVRNAGESTRAELTDRWHLGSCTKPMTATMIAALVERGELSWDTTIAQALPGLAGVMRAEYRQVNVEMLLAHRGGIRHELDVPGLWGMLWKREATPVEERRKMAEVMLAQPPKVPPGQYLYANCGYGIAGHMAESVTGKTWEQLMRELVFEPLGMTSAGFGVPWEGHPITDPWPHSSDRAPISPGPMADNPPSIGPGGTIHASIGDWAKFVIEHLRGARGANGRLLRADTFALLHRSRSGGDETPGYALGWQIAHRDWAKGKSQADTGRCLHHGGSNNSWFCLVWIAPERDFAVLCTTNIGGDGVFPKIDAVTWSVIQDHLSRSAD